MSTAISQANRSEEVLVRAADADRDRVTDRLRTAAAEGRLTPDELEARLETALGAATYAELDAVVADLPARSTPVAVARPRPELRAFLVTAVLLLVIWVLTGADTFWPIWPILGWGAFVVPGALTGGRVRVCRRSA